FAVLEVAEPPATRRRVLFRVLDHELNVLDGPGNGRLEASAGKAAGQDLVVFVRGGFIPMQRGNDCTVRERKRPFPQGPYREVVAQLGAQLLEVASREAGH